MDFEFDPDKDAINRVKHRLPLSFGQRIFDDPFCTIIHSFRPIDGEYRMKAIGEIDGKLFTAVFVLRNEKRRYISVRRSNRNEQRNYDSYPEGSE